MRTIIVHFEDVEITTEALTALSFMSFVWGNDHYDKVMLSVDHSLCGDDDVPSFIAYYENTKTGSTYTMGAVWDKRKKAYGFHS